MRMLGKTRESSTGLIISLVIDGWWVRVGGESGRRMGLLLLILLVIMVVLAIVISHWALAND